MPLSPAVDPLGHDTIAAIATATGRGALALVRISGPGAPDALLRLCPTLAGEPPPARVQRLLAVRHPETGALIDRAVVTFFAAPHSYTGEASVEISTHGGLLMPQLVLAAAYAAGARPALPGEFTRRALINGKLDLVQAEAILDLIEGTSPAFHHAAIQQLERGLSRRIEELRRQVLAVQALVAYGIDFPEEDEPPVSPERIADGVRATLEQVDRLLRSAPQGEMLREGALVVFAGYPNAGKSSLFNALLGFERSIVADLPGTTRDAVDASATIRGFPFRLVDTAGLRETTDQVEEAGVEVSYRYLAAAEIVVYCAEADRELKDGDLEFLGRRPGQKTIVARTKADLTEERRSPTAEGLRVSIITGIGLEELADSLVQLAFGQISTVEPAEAPLVTRERHARALTHAASELRLFLEAFREEGVPIEVAATHLAAATEALEGIIGAVVPDDILSVVFSQFCVGK